MRRHIRYLATVMVGVTTILAVAQPVSAGPGIRTDEATYSGIAVVGGQGSAPGGGRGNCHYVPAASTLAEAPAGEVAVFDAVEYGLYSEICNGTFVRAVWLPLFTPGDVLAMARDSFERTLPEPTPVMVWPDPDFDWAYAQVPIDFRADPSEWRAFQDTATAWNPLQTVSVTIRAEPRELVYTAGDPGATTATAACSGDAPLAGYDPYAPGACSYTYVNASSTAGNGSWFAATLAITWDIEYWSTTHAGFAGSLPPITRETTFPMEVAEVKILGTSHPVP